jgi:hypothetical protein
LTVTCGEIHCYDVLIHCTAVLHWASLFSWLVSELVPWQQLFAIQLFQMILKKFICYI